MTALSKAETKARLISLDLPTSCIILNRTWVWSREYIHTYMRGLMKNLDSLMFLSV